MILFFMNGKQINAKSFLLYRNPIVEFWFTALATDCDAETVQ